MKSYAQVMGVSRTEEYIGTGDAAIENMVQKMKNIINISSKNPYVREWVKNIVARVDVNNKKGEASAIFNFVRDNIRYTKDPYGYEYIHTPSATLEDIRLFHDSKGERPNGDCDDMTLLGLSLLKSIGFETAIKVVSFYESGQYGHVYGLVKIQQNWVPFDAVRTNSYLGWESSGHTRVMETIVQ